MQIDLRHTPFSRSGSYIAFSDLGAERLGKAGLAPGLWLRCVHGDAAREVFRLELLADGAVQPGTVTATPGELTLACPRGRVRVCIAAADVVRVRCEGVGLRLTGRPGSYNCAIPQPAGRWLLNLATAFRNYVAVPLAGCLRVDAPWGIAKCEHLIVDLLPDAATGVAEANLEQCVGTWVPSGIDRPFAVLAAEAEAEFAGYAARCPAVPPAYAETARAAAYLNWSSVVHPDGFFTRRAMLMSKNWMCNVWSWDHAFNALATAYADPALAWDQFLVLFDHQQPGGQLPDFINDIVRLYCFVKPPVHGWVLRKMMRASPWCADSARLRAVYRPLCAWTEWWFRQRNPDGDGLPQYHHGNDSGWDNGTVFDIGLPVKGCDLAAFLIVQMDVLAELAERLGRPRRAEAWRRRADALQATLLERLWRGDRFVCPSAVDGRVSERSDSIFGCLPILLGERLPPAVRAALVASVRRHLTEWGLATENPASPLYEADGYWRGPIWAPPTLIVADGLARAGESALAREIARRFCALCRRSGFAENFDAQSGAPLRDRAYTWTSSVFLVLAHEFLADSAPAPVAAQPRRARSAMK